MKRLLITGGTGFLGSELVRQAETLLPDVEIHATRFTHEPPKSRTIFHQLDLVDRNRTTVLLETIQPDCIIHTAALMGSDGLKPPDAPGAAYPLIHDGTSNVARWCAHTNTRLIHLSTDGLFSGNHAPYTERSIPHPIHRYGEAKYRAELEVLRLRTKGVIVRTSLIYGFDPLDPRSEGLVNGAITACFRDEYRNPIWVVDLAKALLELAESDYDGILHVAGPERLSRFEFAKKTLEQLGLEREIKSTSVEDSDVIRPKDVTLDTSLSRQILRTRISAIGELQR